MRSLPLVELLAPVNIERHDSAKKLGEIVVACHDAARLWMVRRMKCIA